MKRDLPEAAANAVRLKEVVGKKLKAYSILDVKNIQERKEDGQDVHVIRGIATSPRVDRVKDVVVSTGAKFTLPIPLQLYHESEKPVGRVVFAQPSKKGIPFEAVIPKVTEAGVVKDRVDEAIHSLKYRLIGAVSIGFQADEDGVEFLEDGGIQFNSWEWLELSLVGIPANPDATITSFKDFDDDLRAAIGAKQASVKSANKSLPGASGQTVVRIKKDPEMKTYKEQIGDLEATRAAKAARMAEIQKKASEEGRTKDEAEREEFDGIKAELGAIDSELKDLRDLEKLNVAQAQAVNENKAQSRSAAGEGARVTVNAKLEPGIKFARMLQSMARAKYLQKEGQYVSPDKIYRADKRWMESAPDVELALKAAVNAGDSTTTGAMTEIAYAQNITSEFIEFLRPRTLIGRISGWRNVPFNVRVGGQATGTTGYWVGQGAGINPSAATTTSVSLGITKCAGISVITKELAMLSDPSAELMIRNDLVRELQETADAALIDPNNGGSTNVKPQSLTYGATARLASGTDYAAFKADWKSLASNFFSNNISMEGCVVIVKEDLALALSLMVTSLGNPQFPGLTPTGGTLMGLPVFTSQIADTSGSPDFDNVLIVVKPSEVFLADGGASVEVSDQVSLHMDDATTMKSTATSTNTSVVSMFQTESVAVKAVRFINWTKARSAACQYIRSAAYV
jgi:HK97 family phage major capsid protein